MTQLFMDGPLGRNLGLRDGLQEAMVDLVHELNDIHGRTISLVGWSLGGLYARQLAKMMPERVRQVITLGSPFAAGPKATNAWRVYEMASGRRAEEEDPRFGGSLTGAPPGALLEGGFEAEITTSGEEAITILEGNKGKHRALITDINLRTRLTGWHVAKRARELDSDIPVIYMTGAAADQWPSHGVPNSVLLNKPFAAAQIVTAVAQLLNATPPTAPA